MIRVVPQIEEVKETENEVGLEPSRTEQTLLVQNEISSFEQVTDQELDERFYDASEDLMNLETNSEDEKENHTPYILKTKDGKQTKLPEYPVYKKRERKRRQGFTKGLL